VGLRGDVRIMSYTAEPKAIAAYGPLRLGRDGPVRRLRVARSKGSIVVGRLEGVETREGAEAMRGTRLFVARSRLPRPDEDTYYHHDLIGLAVEDPAGNRLGRVRAVHNHGAGDILDIAWADGGSDVIPFGKDWVPLVDLGAGRIVVDLGEEPS
jgi:16S rRNA processing protein RimM